MQNEWTEANNSIWINAVFQVWKPKLNKYIRDNIKRIADDVDTFTKEQIFDIIEQWNELWLWADKIASNISGKFDEFKKIRSLRIARTEITTASNEASEQAYIESWVVAYKEFLAEIDDRTSDICQSLNWKRFKLWEPIFEKWQTIAWYTNDYETAMHPSLHPHCRSTIIPVLIDN
jgi:SPP1 gp7 family putative phage head morphogenesis protein